MAKLYSISISKNKLHRAYFWGWLVLINAIPAFVISLMFMGTEIWWKVLWIITWLLIYVFIVWPNFNTIKNLVFKESLYYAYIFKTFIVIILIGFYFDFCIWIVSILFADNILSFLPAIQSYPIEATEDTLSVTRHSHRINILYIYTTTVIHGWILSVATLMLWTVFFWINSVLIKLNLKK